MMFNIMITTKCLVVFLILLGSIVTQSVIMPPRLYSTNSNTSIISNLTRVDRSSVSESEDEVPYILSINEGTTIDVKTNSSAMLTVNLNRAPPNNVTVEIKVYSGPNLIEFVSGGNSSLNDTKRITITFQADTFGDRIIKFATKSEAGHAEIVCKVLNQTISKIKIDDSSSYISINICKSWELNVLINVVGWIYFAAWSLSFYFQVILNYQRKSVVGLNFDFLALNLLGFACYTIYNFCLMFSREVQNDYYKRYTYMRIPVEYNDLFFAVHAFVLTLITVIQCFIYEVSLLRRKTLYEHYQPYNLT